MKKNNQLLDSDTGTTQAVCWMKWSTYLNISKMYNLVYNVMDEAGLLEKLDSPQWVNMDVGVVNTKEEAFGDRVTHRMKHPEY